jgi:mannose-6-phosphate isomerase-like protein (cupin superfamily)
MQSFHLDQITADREKTGQRWHEFLRVPALSMGIYHLKAGQADPQKPHTEDEVYLVVKGKASFQAAGAKEEVKPGTILFVEKNVEHRFFDIVEDLTVLVFFVPAEGT